MKKLISLTYLFGVVFILASALYFFASNWQAFSRLEKVALSACVFLLFYGTSFVLDRILKGVHFLSNWLLISGVISFGLSVALLGQLYNSHADSYLLFLIWFIPSLLLSLHTRYSGFYVLTHILFHLTIYFYLFPTSPFTDWVLFHTFIAFGVAIFNSLLFLIVKKGYIHSKPLLYLSLLTANILFIVTTFGNDFSFFFSLFYLLIIGFGIFRFFQEETSLFIILSVFGTGFVIIKMFTIMVQHFSNLFFVTLLLAAFLLLAGSVFLVNYLRIHSYHKWVKTILIASVTSIASVFLVAAVFGLLSLAMMEVSMVTLFIFSTILLVIPSTLTSWPSPVKYSLTLTGVIIAMVASTVDKFSFVMFFVLAFVFYFEKRASVRTVFYILFQLNLGIFLGETMNLSLHVILVLMLVINLLCFLVLYRKHLVQFAAFLIGFLIFFSLTTINLSLSLHLMYTALFFIAATGGVYYFKKQNQPFYWVSSLVFWFMLIVQLYYDLAWKLVHKSILLLVLGTLFLMVAVYFDKRIGIVEQSVSILKGKRMGILLILFLQVGWIGYQVYSNETLLQHGKTVTLKLEPVDPRSLLQGDYVQLNYSISQIPDTSFEGKKGPITIVLRENDQGIHEYAGIYKLNKQWNTSYDEKTGDVLLNGKVISSWDSNAQVTYGIEHFFIPEGTGMDVEGKVDFAVVKVSESGNGIIFELK
ncbi:GDYXXLXY domain-containing protein [Rossellomorea aquimaris]|uniref:GDYXXLXY domain-containing protein n=1 Tax=Rossellomorea aquimaris TaxID=189382 RepID=UPI0007D0B32E|nr:GDYXXLXY domain-containing protein [Rossellomorea aquimaris]